MIDFRYHIVSLISVFLALAVGIVLGAGPLRDYIADSLSGQVSQLREESERLRGELEQVNDDLADANSFISGASDSLTRETLPGYTVSLITLPGSDSADLTAVSDTLSEAGASVLNIVEVTDTFTDPAKRAFRSGIAANASPYMDPEPSDDASAESVLGAALGQALTNYDPAEPQRPSEDASAIMELLRSSELVSADGEIQPTMLTVVIASASAAAEEIGAAELGLVKGLDPAAGLVAGEQGEGTLVHLIRSDSEAAQTITTTDSLSTTVGLILLPRALAVVVSGEHGSYGFGDGADAVFPPNVDISAPEPVEPAGDEEEDEDPQGADGQEGAEGDDPQAFGAARPALVPDGVLL